MTIPAQRRQWQHQESVDATTTSAQLKVRLPVLVLGSPRRPALLPLPRPPSLHPSHSKATLSSPLHPLSLYFVNHINHLRRAMRAPTSDLPALSMRNLDFCSRPFSSRSQ